MDEVPTYSEMQVQAQDVVEGDIWIVPGIDEPYPVSKSFEDPAANKPFWILVGRERGSWVDSVHNPKTLLAILRRDREDQGEFEDEVDYDEDDWDSSVAAEAQAWFDGDEE